MRFIWLCRPSLALLLASFLPLTALAADEVLAYDRVSFVVSVQERVRNDWVSCRFSVSADGDSASEVSEGINRKMDAALQRLRGFSSLMVSTGEYRVYPRRDRDGDVEHWLGSQALLVEAGDVGQVSKAIAAVEDLAVIGSMQFSLTPSRREQVQEVLLDKALKAFAKRAERIRAAMGVGSYRLVFMSIQEAGKPQAPVLALDQAQSRFLADARGVQQAAVAPGLGLAQVTVSGTIELSQR